MSQTYPKFGQIVYLKEGTASYEMMRVVDKFDTVLLKKSASRPFVVVSSDKQNRFLSMVTVSPLKTVHHPEKLTPHQLTFVDQDGETREVVRSLYSFPKNELLIAKRDKDIEGTLKHLLMQKSAYYN